MRRIYLVIVIALIGVAFYLGRLSNTVPPVLSDPTVEKQLRAQLKQAANHAEFLEINLEHQKTQLEKAKAQIPVIDRKIKYLTHFYETKINSLTGATAADLDSLFTARYPDRLKYSDFRSDSDSTAMARGVNSEGLDTLGRLRQYTGSASAEDRQLTISDIEAGSDRTDLQGFSGYDADSISTRLRDRQHEKPGRQGLTESFEAEEKARMDTLVLSDRFWLHCSDQITPLFKNYTLLQTGSTQWK